MAPLVWNPGVELPAPRAQADALVVDEAIFLLGGATRDVLRLGANDANWGLGAQLDEPRRWLGAVAQPGGGFVVYGGEKSEPFDAAVFYDYYDHDAENNLANMNAQRTQIGYGGDTIGRAYAFGGLNEDGVVLATSERYDPATDVWSSVASLPTARFGMASASDGAGNIYVFGGATANTSGSVSDSAYRYNVAANAWTSLAALPAAVRNAAAARAPSGRIYVIGGAAGATTVATVQSYDPATNTWSVETSLPEALNSAAAAIDADGRLVVIGGRDQAGVATTHVWVTQDLAAPDTPPVITSTPSGSVFATGGFQYILTAEGNPPPSYQIVTAPAGVSLSPQGLLTWTPTLGQVGTWPVTVRATNFVGSVEQSFSVSVVDPQPVISSTPSTAARTSQPYSYQAVATGYPTPTFSLSTGPVGMTISAGGALSWTPSVTQVGSHLVTVRASNVHGFVEQSYTMSVVDGTPPSIPTNLHVASNTSNSLTFAWDASTDNVGVAGYRVYKTSRCGWRGSRTCYSKVQDGLTTTTTTIGNLSAGVSYNYAVSAYDAAGNESAKTAKVSGTTTKPPTVSYLYGSLNAPIQAYATHALSPFSIYASGVPTPTLEFVSGPAGLTFDPATARVTWTPTDADVGAHTATFRATNSVGSAEVTATIDVAANLPRLTSTFTYFGLTYAVPFAVEGDPFTLQLRDTFSGAPITWSLVAGPVGVNVDPVTGAVQWVPTAADLGDVALTFRGANYAGSADLTLTFPVYPIGTDKQPPSTIATGIVVSNIDLTRATVSWPAATDNVAIAGYKITAYYQFRSRGMHTVYSRFDSVGESLMYNMTGLRGGHNYTLYIQPYDAAGNTAGIGQIVHFVTTADPNLPTISYAFSNNQYQAIADQPLTVQLTDSNPIGGATWSLVGGPAGMGVDAGSGHVSWTPSYADVGSAAATFRATNAYGYRDVSVNFPVYFTGPVRGVGVSNASAATRTATVAWTPPTDTSRVAGYKVYLSWSVGGRQRGSTVYTSPGLGTSFQIPWLVGGPVLFKATVSAYDDAGHIAAPYYPSTSFILS